MLLHFVLELLFFIILATDTSWHTRQSRHSRALRRPGGGGVDGVILDVSKIIFVAPKFEI